MSDAMAHVVDEEVARLLSEAHDRSEAILRRHREFLDRMSDLLMKVEVIDGVVATAVALPLLARYG